MELVACLYHQPNLNYQNSLQNAHVWTSDHMSFFHARKWFIWNVLVTRSILQKRMDQIGVLNQKLCHFELPCTPCDHLAITSQPIIRWSWNRTFWKGERKIYNFHVHEKSIWSFFDVEKSSWMWTKNLPNLQTLNYRSFSIFSNFCHDLWIFKMDV